MTAQIETSAERVQMKAQRDMDQGQIGDAYTKFKAAAALFLRAMERQKAVSCAISADQCVQKIRDEIEHHKYQIDFHQEQLDALRDMLEETK